MKFMFIFFGFLFNSARSDSGSFESSYNGIELSPFYDTIILSDIADIIKEFESGNVPTFDKVDNNDSDESIEDLLSEYQNYLEKEQKQRKEYIERSKLKNKVPLLRHDRYSKTNFGNNGKYNDWYRNGYYNFDTLKSKNPLDLFIPANPKNNIFSTIEPITTLDSGDSAVPFSFPKFPFRTPCCKNGEMSCKQCMTVNNDSRNRLEPRIGFNSNDKKSYRENKLSDLTDTDDALNIRIKVDVQLPKLYENLIGRENRNSFNVNDGSNMKDFPLAIQMPSSYYNLPIPMNLFGYKRISKPNSAQLHRLTIHKKKKSKSNNSSKKHRKKLLTFHDIKLEPQQIYEAHFGKLNMSADSARDTHSTQYTIVLNSETGTTAHLDTNFSSTSTPFEQTKVNTTESHTEENIFMLVNISNNIVRDTEETTKSNNSIETEFTNAVSNPTTTNTLHVLKKREVTSTDKSEAAFDEMKVIGLNKTALPLKHGINVTKVNKNNTKKIDKHFPNEEELLDWPSNNGSQSEVSTKNITTIIIESEIKRAKINMTKEMMRRNHTSALEKAIFGDVDWNDVDTVAPAFLSFVGKYIEGTLTFCSDNICHSMKCGHKACTHRVCSPKNRLNNKGHCMGSNNTESVATLESIMDLPSNVVFEIVDILQDKMVGKLFGKVTLCISSKCTTFIASKKTFIKYKCLIKEISPKGHCISSKDGKVT